MTEAEVRTDRDYLTYLRRLMVRRFTISELETLCFDLGVDVETLPGGRSKLDLVRGLIDHLEKRQRIPDLVAYIPKTRDDIQLKPLPEPSAVPYTVGASTAGVTAPDEPTVEPPSPRDPQLSWSFALPGQSMAAPVILGDICLVASQESGGENPGAVLRALSLTKGDVRWERRFAGAVIGGVTRITKREALVSLPTLGRLPGESALLAVDGEGRILWRTEFDGHQISAPAACHRVTAVTANAREVKIVEVRTGKLLASASMPVDVALSAPACDGACVYVPCRAPSLIALGLDGEVRWRFDVEGVLSGVQISQTPLVVGEYVIAVLTSGVVLALTRSSGHLAWESAVGPRGKPLTAPVTDGKRLFLGARDGVYALSLEYGRQLWVFRTGAYVSAPPVVAGDVLCVAGNDRHLYGIDPRQGEPMWQYAMPQETKLPPALAAGGADGPYAVVVDCSGNVTGLTYPVSATAHEKAGRWAKAARMWEVEAHPRRAAEAWCRHAESLGDPTAGDADSRDARARSWMMAAHLFASVSAVERAGEAHQRYAQVLELPLITVEVSHGGLVLDAWSRLKLTFRNGGYGVARNLVIRAAGDHFEGQIAETQELAALPIGQSETRELAIKPIAHGDSVPLRIQMAYLDQNGEPHRREETIYLSVAKELAKRVPGALRILAEQAGGLGAFGVQLSPPMVDLEIRLGRGAQHYNVEVTLNGGQVFQGGRLARSVQSWSPSGDAIEDGRFLFESLFRDGAVRKAWHIARDRAQSGGALRRVRLRIDEEVAELHRLPWELLYDDEIMVAACEATPFSRYLPVEKPWGGPITERPIRVLGAIASPRDLADRYDLPPLDVKLERYLLANAFAGIDPEQIRLEFLPPPVTLERLSRAMREGYHWLHLVGHGRYNTRMERMDLLLEDASGSTRAIASHLVCRMLAHQGFPPQLVYLAVCQSALGPEGHVLTGLAAELVAAGVPAVVAMRDRVHMRSAQRVARYFYEGLARHGMVDRALNQARDSLLSGDLAGVASPVLFMRLASGKLWEVD
jgi:outer membrane protein assembly factor BamB